MTAHSIQPENLHAPIAIGLAAHLAASGFDLVAAGRVGDYHRGLPPGAEAYRLHGFADDRMLVLVGHSRAVWAPFMAQLAAEPWRRAAANPLDEWTAEVVAAALQAVVAPGIASEVFAYHEPPPRRVAMQWLAAALGLASRGPAGLSAHPLYGPWIAFRAAVVIDVAGEGPDALDDVCARCVGTPCAPALEAALVATPQCDQAGVREAWRRWVAVRDACPLGRAARYNEGQLVYHYTGERRALGQEGA